MKPLINQLNEVIEAPIANELPARRFHELGKDHRTAFDRLVTAYFSSMTSLCRTGTNISEDLGHTNFMQAWKYVFPSTDEGWLLAREYASARYFGTYGAGFLFEVISTTVDHPQVGCINFNRFVHDGQTTYVGVDYIDPLAGISGNTMYTLPMQSGIEPIDLTGFRDQTNPVILPYQQFIHHLANIGDTFAIVDIEGALRSLQS